MATKNVVLVHGGFVDGSGWQGVYNELKKDGYTVSIVQNPTLSLEGDSDATKRIIDAQGEPVVLAGHSYGGAVITEAGNDPNVAALVYIAAFAPDMGDSQVPWGVDALGGTISEAAWASKPSWYLITTDDRMIPPRLSGRCRTNG